MNFQQLKSSLLAGMILFSGSVIASEIYSIDASKRVPSPENELFKMGNPGPFEKEIRINSQYITIGGIPVLPIMGELHFSRLRKDQWEDCILKMKACGVNIVAFYIFWNHHEEIENQFNWDDNLNVREFVELCAKHELYAYPRIGPWAHGEARNGGTPDWILRKPFVGNRSNEISYQQYAARFYAQIANQLQGLYYKDGGPIIGIQLENEYRNGQRGETHIQWLKDQAKSLGMDVPIYTVTGWGGGSVPPFEVIPLWGGYPDEPWKGHVKQNILPANFRFDSFRDNEHIGNEPADVKKGYMDYSRYPYLTCEMGIGIQNTYHRRLKINPIDGLGMMTAKLGSGSNLLGYYVFAGGTQPYGILTGTEEEQEETGYWNRLPAKSYDFQAAVKESGELSESYRKVKKLHYFLNDFGYELAPMFPSITVQEKEDALQLSVRTDNHSAYLFGINYCRYVPKSIRKSAKFKVKLAEETIEFPKQAIDIPDSTFFIWPINLNINQVLLKYATAQLLCRLENTHIFYQNGSILPEFAFDAKTVDRVTSTSGKITVDKDQILLSGFQSGKENQITLWKKDGSAHYILVLTEKEAENAWCFHRNGKKEFYLSSAGMYVTGNELMAFSPNETVIISRLGHSEKWNGEEGKSAGKFTDFIFKQDKKEIRFDYQPQPLFMEAQWLEAGNFDQLSPTQELFHRYFFKEFSLDNPSHFRKANLYIYPESDCSLKMNEQWVRQEIKAGQLNVIDLTGYLKKGENGLILDFPYETGLRRFAARLIVEYGNYDRIEFNSDVSWLAGDMSIPPSPLKAFKKPEKPTVVASPDWAEKIRYEGFSEWNLKFEALVKEPVYVHLDYKGDRAELYNGHRLCADDFNANVPWQIGLQRLTPSFRNESLRLVIYPLSKNARIFFDTPPGTDEYGPGELKNIQVKPEYLFIMNNE